MRTSLKEVAAVAAGTGVVFAALFGCATPSDVRIVHVTGEGGELAVVGDRNKAAPQANAEMARICTGAGQSPRSTPLPTRRAVGCSPAAAARHIAAS